MMAEHTPGPWRMQLGSSGPRIYAVRRDDRVHRDPLVVGVGGSDANVSRANARLIAAAPELLVALREIAGRRYTPDADMRDAMLLVQCIAEDAIRKAGPK